jgi:hypothetical protein
MALWVKDENGNFINLDHESFYKVTANDEGGGVFKLRALTLDADTADEDWVRLNGSWASLADARSAFARLVGALDPSTYGDND